MKDVEPKVTNALKWILSVFEKYKVTYQIAGGFAARLYGATRPINDIDIDIPREKFEEILPDVKEFVTFGPEYFKGEKWELYEMVLTYHGQEVDLTAADMCRVYDHVSYTWKDCSADLSKADTVVFKGLTLNVCPRPALIAYKQFLTDMEHQKQDIAEISK